MRIIKIDAFRSLRNSNGFPFDWTRNWNLKKKKIFFLVYLQIGAWAAGSGRNGLGAGRIPNLMKCCWVPVFWNADEASGTHATPRRRRINAGPLIACHLSLISKKKEKKRYWPNTLVASSPLTLRFIFGSFFSIFFFVFFFTVGCGRCGG